ncbi:unnamed protein product [Urochloa decumbens]|uniref:F-box protein n=1 Tax=Urochloa decumbens TaxID=240449 RepID=A0ABC8ZXQ8_9POAL
MLWRAARREGHIVLRNRAGGCLRANGSYLTWRTAVTVGGDNRSPMMMWALEVVPLGLRSVLVESMLHNQVHTNEKQVKNDKPPHEQSLAELLDCVSEIAMRLPSRADILRLAATSRHLWKTIGSRDFNDSYYSAKGTSMSELIGVLNTRGVQIMALSVNASVPISLDGVNNRFGTHIIDCHGGLLLLKDDLSGGLIVYDPTNGRSIFICPPPVPQDWEFVAAGIVTDTYDEYSVVIALYAEGYSSFLLGQEKAWIATCRFYPKVNKWKIFDNEINFNLKAVEIKSPSVVAGREWHLLNLNSFIISVSLEEPHSLRIQSLPFRQQMLTPSHILGRTKQCQLALIAREDGDLTAWEYKPYNLIQNQTGEAKEYKRVSEFPQIPFLAFAQENSLLLSDHLICFGMETGQFELPFLIPAEEVQGTRNVLPYEMA